ncbi:MAG TPA: acyltransferase family protein [Candidatus Tetragenococcus pullicola]|nr:acyltransferase family protein [Candidatus Tetragenococcus pullicola]
MSTILPLKSKRDPAFDTMRAILIFLVVFGHSLEYFRLENTPATFLYIFIYLFHMPVFVFISGYFSKNIEKGRQTAVKTFLIPYLIFNLLLSIFMLLTGRIQEVMILNPGWTLWFLYCMFGWRILLPDLVKIRYVLFFSFIFGVLSGLLTEFGTYMAMARTFGFLPYFLAGYFCQQEQIQKIRMFPFRRLISLIIVSVALFVSYLWTKSNLPPELLWGDRAYGLFDTPLYQTFLADLFLYLLSFSFIFVFLTLTSQKRFFFTSWGQHTLSIYLLHIYLIAPLIEATEKIKNPALHFLLLLLGSLITTYLLSLPIVSHQLSKILNKIVQIIMPEKSKEK